jgi:dTDP-4-dehydrorhamnose 3,5-epimerase
MQDVVHARPSLGAAVLEDVEGFTSASPRQSLTTGAGALRVAPIDGVRYRLARPVSHHHGHLTEVFRADWGLTDAPVVQVNATTTFPGRIRAWGIHRLTVDRLFAATGSLCIVCYDGRRGSLTFGCVNEFMLGERNQGLIVIPPGIISRVEECRGGRGDDRQHAEPTLRPRRSRSLGAAVGLRGRPKNHPVPMAIAPGSVLRGSTLSSGDGASLFERIAPRL